MGPKTMHAKLSSLEEQFRVLKAQVEADRKGEKPLAFSSLYGILKGKIASTEEEIDQALYRKPSKGR